MSLYNHHQKDIQLSYTHAIDTTVGETADMPELNENISNRVSDEEANNPLITEDLQKDPLEMIILHTHPEAFFWLWHDFDGNSWISCKRRTAKI